MSLKKGSYCLVISLQKSGDVAKERKYSSKAHSLADVVAIRDRLMLAAVSRLREAHGERGVAAPDSALSGRMYRNKRPFDAKSTGVARDTAHAWKRLGAPAVEKEALRDGRGVRPGAKAKAGSRSRAGSLVSRTGSAQQVEAGAKGGGSGEAVTHGSGGAKGRPQKGAGRRTRGEAAGGSTGVALGASSTAMNIF